MIMKFWVILFITSFVSVTYAGKRKPQGKLTYALNWVGGFTECENFDNKVVDYSSLVMKKDTPTSTILTGSMNIKETIETNTALIINIEKETPQGKVLAYTMDVTDICDHIADEGMPWSLFVNAMNLDPKSCPIPAKEYPINDLKLSLSFADEAMNHETVGEYAAKIEYRRKGQGLDVIEHDVSCHLIGFTVDERREEE